MAVAAALLAAGLVAAGSVAAAPRDPAFRALSGADAARFSLPPDMRVVKRLSLPALGGTYERYQQVFGDREADVLGGQIVVYRDQSGTASSVIGARYAEIQAGNRVALSASAARNVAEREVGRAGRRITTLMIDPRDRRYFYRVDTRRLTSRWMHWIDAGNGKVIKRYDAIADDHGTGVKGDSKAMTGLTTFHGAAGHGAGGAHWDLFSADGRQETYDMQNGKNASYYVTDLDNHWTTPGRTSPGHPALVDAQYYANTTDDYYLSRFGFNWSTGCYPDGMQSLAHYQRNYSNAFWTGTHVVYGDGDGTTDREYSGALDIVAHEFTHGVTECTSDLIYQDEPGALNESFSDVLGGSAEFAAAEPATSGCTRATGQAACADWWVGEDIDLVSDSLPGFRNMADPREDGDPDHYTERYTGTADGGGVHTNSGIPNHAYYLLVNGGKNAGCDGIGSDGHTHTLDCGATVTGVGVTDAQRIFFRGFTSLPSTATMCQARAGTEAAAGALFGAGSQQQARTSSAWQAVGVYPCGTPPPQPPGVTTGAASGVTHEAATLNGSVDPNGSATTYRFEYGTASSYGSSTASQSAGSGTSGVDVSAGVSGLAAETTYHFRLVASNAAGTSYGSDQTFSTATSTDGGSGGSDGPGDTTGGGTTTTAPSVFTTPLVSPQVTVVPDTTAPSLTTPRLASTAFRAARSGPSVAATVGTRVSYSLSEAATTRFGVERATAGRKLGGRCVRPTSRNRNRPRCTRWVRLRGSFSHPGKVGSNDFRFRGRLAGRTLRPRRYRLVAAPTDAAGNVGARRRAAFRILP
jgi:bacillolysin